MQANRALTKPNIALCVSPHAGYERKIREIQAGMEEEGVPYTVNTSTETNAVALAFQGACQSQLGVGVGVGPDGICVHFHKLPADQPLFSASAGTAGEWRRYGYNAARLVKGIPFKEDEPAETAEASEDVPALYQMIQAAIQKVLQENAQAMGRDNTWSIVP